MDLPRDAVWNSFGSFGQIANQSQSGAMPNWDPCYPAVFSPEIILANSDRFIPTARAEIP